MKKTELGYLISFMESHNWKPRDEFHWEKANEYLVIKPKIEPRLQFECLSHPNSFNSFQVKWMKYAKVYRLHTEPGEMNIKGVCGRVELWMNEIDRYKEELYAPDPLDGYWNKSQFDFGYNEVNQFQQYSDEEKANLKASVKKLKVLVEEKYQLSQSVKEYIDEKFEYLEGKIDTLNRHDFNTVARKILYDIGVSATANVIVDVGQAVVTVAISSEFMELIKAAFVFGFKLLLGH